MPFKVMGVAIRQTDPGGIHLKIFLKGLQYHPKGGFLVWIKQLGQVKTPSFTYPL
jgi:hypothetical protein